MNDDAMRAAYEEVAVTQEGSHVDRWFFEAGWRAREAQADAMPRYQVLADGTLTPLDGPLREHGEVMAMALRLLFATSGTLDFEEAWEKAHGALVAWEAAAAHEAVKPQ